MSSPKTTLAFALPLALAASFLPAAAEAGPGRGRHPGGGPLAAARHLELTDEQRAAAREIFENARDAAEPHRDVLRESRGRLRDALEGESPDPAAVGALVVRMDAARDQLRAVLEAARADFRALLTDEQRERLDAFRERHPGPFARRGFHRFGGPGFGGPGGDGFGRGGGFGGPAFNEEDDDLLGGDGPF